MVHIPGPASPRMGRLLLQQQYGFLVVNIVGGVIMQAFWKVRSLSAAILASESQTQSDLQFHDGHDGKEAGSHEDPEVE
jgi:hypothetical protein